MKRAGDGDPDAAENLRRELEAHPEMREVVREFGALADKAEAAWVELASGGNVLAAEALRSEVAALKAELAGDRPTLVERLIVGTLAAAYLAHHYAVGVSAQPAPSPSVEAFRHRRAEGTQRRMLAAVKAWELYLRSRSKGAKPKVLKLFAEGA